MHAHDNTWQVEVKLGALSLVTMLLLLQHRVQSKMTHCEPSLVFSIYTSVRMRCEIQLTLHVVHTYACN